MRRVANLREWSKRGRFPEVRRDGIRGCMIQVSGDRLELILVINFGSNTFDMKSILHISLVFSALTFFAPHSPLIAVLVPKIELF